MKIAWKLLPLALALTACAHAEQWSKTFTITGHPSLRIDTGDGNIRVDTWDQNTIEAKVTTTGWSIGGNGVRVSDHQHDDSVELEVREPRVSFSFSMRKQIDVEIHMPRAGTLQLHTGDGRISLSNFKGSMDLDTSDGSQDIVSVDGRLRAHSGDGRITVNGRFDALDLTSGDGRIEARTAAGSSVESSWSLRSGDGGVTLQIPETLKADVDIHTGDGHVTVDLPVAVEGRLGEKNIHGKLNGGGNLLSIHTGDGSIRLQKS